MIVGYCGITRGGKGFFWVPNHFINYYVKKKEIFIISSKKIKRSQDKDKLLERMNSSGWSADHVCLDDDFLDKYYDSFDDGTETNRTALILNEVFKPFKRQIYLWMGACEKESYLDAERDVYSKREDDNDTDNWWLEGGKPSWE